MTEITFTLSGTAVQLRPTEIVIAYRSLSHADFNILIAAYKALGFYRETSLTLVGTEQPVAEEVS